MSKVVYPLTQNFAPTAKVFSISLSHPHLPGAGPVDLQRVWSGVEWGWREKGRGNKEGRLDLRSHYSSSCLSACHLCRASGMFLHAALQHQIEILPSPQNAEKNELGGRERKRRNGFTHVRDKDRGGKRYRIQI